MKKFILPLLLIVSFTQISNAQSFSEIIKAVADDRASGDYFGYSVSISGDYAIVGAYTESEDATGGNSVAGAGSAYILKKDQGGIDNWGQIQKIVASDRASADGFGFSVSISGDYVIVGAHLEAHDAAGGSPLTAAGSAYIFKKNGAGSWIEVEKIVANDRGGGDYFGYSVSISGDYAIVGAYTENNDATGTGSPLTGAGSAYIFKNDGASWTQFQKIVANDRGGGDYFGYSVSISGDYAIVGAYTENEDATGGSPLTGAGSAYIFKNNGASWTQFQKIVASDRGGGDYFGHSVSISGDYAIVGAYTEKEDAAGAGPALTGAGSAYIFKNNGVGSWIELQKIVASDRASGDYFGYSVSISGDYAIVGAYTENEDAGGINTATGAGSAYIFKKDQDGINNWGQLQKIVASDRASGDYFGYSVSISGDYTIVGAYTENEDAAGLNTATGAGSAYIFKTGVVLPVELSYFKGENTTAGNLLTWQTASEENNEGFDIQRSADGKNWEILDFVAGNGMTLETQNYTFTDDAPLAGVNYYRLKQVDFDGQFEYSNIVNIQTIESSKHQTINIYPNPVTDELTIENGQGTAIIYNAVGQSVQEVDIDASKVQLTVSELPQGIYTIHIRKTNGESITKQFVK
jgi:hypothetical protein